MSDVIRLLPDSVANQIAAGEVVERPASVVKELVENAADAGATAIHVVIKDAGRTLIQVVDNGRGMSETDARMAFERHATSKISSADDLFALHTMGFRGEALPSICAVAHVELRTRTAADSYGTCLRIEGSKVVAQEPCACEQGTNIMVRNLFYNIPVRRKFLKSDNVELSGIMREFERLALVNLPIHMTIDTGNRRLDLRPATLKQRINDIWKNNLRMQLLPVEVETSLVRISGYVSRPEFARRRNPLQFMMVNGRNMRHAYFQKAVCKAYEGLIPADAQPCYFINFDVAPDSVDVNRHPSKLEIKFENEKEIWTILQAAVKGSLGKYGAVPSIDFSSDALPVDPPRPGDFVTSPSAGLDPGYSPFTSDSPAAPSAPTRFSSGTSAGPGRESRRGQDWEALYAGFTGAAKVQSSAMEKTVTSPEGPVLPGLDERRDAAPICLQHDNTYIVTPGVAGLMIIDQHRAHVKILYEQFVRRAADARMASQRLMFPIMLDLDPDQAAAYGEVEEELSKLGFIIEKGEGTSLRIVGVPPSLGSGSPEDLIRRIVDSVCDDSLNYGMEGSPSSTLLEALSLTLARAGAIKRGRKLSVEEMEHLVAELFRLPDPALSPSGKPVMRLLQDDYLKNLFLI